MSVRGWCIGRMHRLSPSLLAKKPSPLGPCLSDRLFRVLAQHRRKRQTAESATLDRGGVGRVPSHHRSSTQSATKFISSFRRPILLLLQRPAPTTHHPRWSNTPVSSVNLGRCFCGNLQIRCLRYVICHRPWTTAELKSERTTRSDAPFAAFRWACSSQLDPSTAKAP